MRFLTNLAAWMSTIWLFLSYLVSDSSAIEVSADSPCAELCIDSPGANVSSIYSSSTVTSMVVCNDTALAGVNSTSDGRKWTSCMECLETSDYVSTDSGENDLYWFLFNMKFSFDWCTLGFTDQENPEVDESQVACLSSCQAIKPLTTYELLKTDMGLQYAYCNQAGVNYTQAYGTCRDCLKTVPLARTLSQYTEAMNVACETTPGNGSALSLTFDVFATASTSSSISTSTASSTSTSAPTTSSTAATAPTTTPVSSTGLSGGAKAGVGVGVAAAAIVAALGGICLLRRRRNQRNVQAELESPNEGYPMTYEAAKVPPYQDSSSPQSYQELSSPQSQPDPVEMGQPPVKNRIGSPYHDQPPAELA
ncbi:hypothetical protein BP5796_04951 [Coleophoma crateriformis]|uniref:LPXTG-domain-containing protein n=1 Tax=Coleophoma crateriformis TaxID=565419 RepID=A0A3D8SAZ8_9HELO|nr:hypothetical protein BP5796_04951 [Coleophoma crateriformis]